MTAAVAEALAAALPGAVEEAREFRGETTLIVARDRILEVLAYLRDQARPPFPVLTDLTALDLFPTEPRFAVVYLLTAYDPPARLRLKARVSGADPLLPSATALWPAAESLEREVYDMFGIRFAGHPELTRILMPDDYEGHPLRKDFPLVEEPVEFAGRVPKVPSEIIPRIPPRDQPPGSSEEQ